MAVLKALAASSDAFWSFCSSTSSLAIFFLIGPNCLASSFISAWRAFASSLAQIVPPSVNAIVMIATASFFIVDSFVRVMCGRRATAYCENQ